MKFFSFLFFLLLNVSCNKEKNTKNSLDEKKESLKILFTGNINAELEPCGCRQFPLGGINHMHGLISELNKKSEFIFVDSGDAFFKQNFPMNDEKESQIFRAKKLSKALSMTGLRLKVLGDQDLAFGIDSLVKIVKDQRFHLLGTNLESDKLKLIKFKKYKFNQHEIYFLGISSSKLFTKSYTHLTVKDSISNIMKQINALKEHGYNKENKFHHLILISHSGMKEDKVIAKNIPEIDWIIGSHSQNFTQKPVEEGRTRIVQMLSRNHYIGDITFDKKSAKTTFNFHEVNQDLAQKVKDNPLTSFVDKFQKELNIIQKSEQKKHSKVLTVTSSDMRLPTATTCMDCHDTQGVFWQKTAHSLAYITLVNNDSENNLECLKCHSVGLKEKNGFTNVSDMIISDNKPLGDDYWKEVFSKKSPATPIRDWTDKQRLEHSEHWYNVDLKRNVSHNYSNVQCLNCHNYDPAHLDGEDPKKESFTSIKNKCLNCHNSDQSDHWYKENNDLNEKVFKAAWNKVKCPQTEE
jgi:hypothetical protein